MEEQRSGYTVYKYAYTRQLWPFSQDNFKSVTKKVYTGLHLCLWYRARRYLADCCVPVSEVSGHQHLCSASRRKLNIPRFRRSTFGTRASQSPV